MLLHAFEVRALRAAEDGAPLPYRVEQLAEHGIAVTLSGREHRRPWTWAPVRRAIRSLERIGVPFIQLLLAAPELASTDATIAMFESQGNAMAVLRALHVPPFTKPRFVVVACWLSNELERAGRLRRGLYRWAYRSVDALIYFSSNQGDVYADRLGMAEGRLHSLPFGVDTEYFRPDPAITEADYVVAIGRDAGRDWATLLAAVRGTDLRVRIACRANALDGLDIPSNVEVEGFIDRERYRDLLAGARIVAVVTKVLPYPTGQSVLLEAMAMGKACVVTDAPALSEYTRDEVDAVRVPPGAPEALRAALSRLDGDAALRARLGSVAGATVAERFSTSRMWASVANVLEGSRRDRA